MKSNSRRQYSALLTDPHASHRQQLFWQIGLPLGVTVLLVVALAVLAALATAQDASQGVHWASISLIVLILPLYVAGLVMFVFITLFIYGVARLYQVLPIYTIKARAFVYRAGAFALEYLNRVVQPVIALRGGWAGLQRTIDRLRTHKTD